MKDNLKAESKFKQNYIGILLAFLIVILPFLYFYSELTATTVFELIIYFSLIYQFVFTSTLETTRDEIIFWFLTSVWLLLAGLSVLNSVEPIVSTILYPKLLALVASSYLCSKYFSDEKSYSLFFKITIIISVIHSAICFSEYIIAAPIPATWIDPGMKNLIRTRCAGVFTDPNIFGAFLSSIFIFSTGFLFKCENKLYRILAQFALVASGISLFMTLSRGAWVGLAAGLVTMFILIYFKLKSKPDLKPLFIVFAILFVVFMAGPFKYRFISLANPKDMTISQRSLINKAIFQSIYKIPLTGFGLHSFNQVYPQFRIVGGDYPMNAHNEFLHSLVETGPFAVLFMILITLFILYKVIVSKNLKILDIIFISSFTSLFVHNLTGFSSRILPTSMLIAISLGGMMPAIFSESEKKKLSFKARLAVIFIAFTMLVVSIYGYVINSNLIRANYFIYNNQADKALKILNDLEKLAPSFSNIQNSKYKALVCLNEHDEAIKCIKKAAKLNPSEALYWITLATNEKDPEKAVSYFNKTISLDPASEIYRLQYATFLYMNGKPQKALIQLNTALKYSPGHFNVYTNYKKVIKLKDIILKHMNK